MPILRSTTCAAGCLSICLSVAGQESRPRPLEEPYALERPDASLALPAALTEISALTDVDGARVACLQDEHGILFFVSLEDGKVEERIRFGPDGDYEGLTRVGRHYFVLRSDGMLLELSCDGVACTIVATRKLPLPHADLEGLCYDAAHGRLLIAPKDRAEDEDKDDRPIHAFDLATQRLLPEPVLVLSRKKLRADAEKLLGITTGKGKKKDKDERLTLRLRMSSLAVHPLSGDYYVLSAIDRALLVIARDGRLHQFHRFDDGMPQPEGITFLSGGDLVIASEGKKAEEGKAGSPAVLRVYRMRKKARDNGR
jgi:uncharacterized protein YjiK